MIDDWTPAQEDMDWTQNHFNNMAVDDTWSVSGALLQKTSESELSLIQFPSESSMAVERVAAVCNEIDIHFNMDNAELIEDPMQAAQDAAKEWVDPESDIPLINFNLDQAEWSVTVVPSQDEKGESILTDQWVVRVTHPNDDGDEHEVLMTPMDYHLIAGDDLFFSWRGMRVVEREEAIHLANTNLIIPSMADGSIVLLGDKHTKDGDEQITPPHLRGMLLTNLSGEEE